MAYPVYFYIFKTGFKLPLQRHMTVDVLATPSLIYKPLIILNKWALNDAINGNENGRKFFSDSCQTLIL